MSTVKDILDTYRRGDRLDDAELTMLRDQMRLIADATSDFGDLFLLSSVYARQVERACSDFLKARSEKARWDHANGGGVNV